MQILITGGTGLIGRRLCRALQAEGHQLTVLSRKPETVADKCGSGIQAIASLEAWQPSQTFDAVINLAGEPIADRRWSKQRKQTLWDSRVAVTEELVGRIAAAKCKPAVLLSASAIGYYGGRDDTELNEDSTPGADFPAQLCIAWETAARAAEAYGVRVCIQRTGLVLSTDGGLLGRMLPPFRMGMGARIGNGKQWMSWIHIEDCIEIMLRLLRDEQMHGAYNLTAPRPATNADFTRTLAAVLHRPAPLVAPASMIRLALGEAAGLLLEGQRVLPNRLERARCRFRHPDLSGALEDLLD